MSDGTPNAVVNRYLPELVAALGLGNAALALAAPTRWGTIALGLCSLLVIGYAAKVRNDVGY